MEFKYKGEKISENYKGDLISGKPMIIELKRGEKRSLVAIAVGCFDAVYGAPFICDCEVVPENGANELLVDLLV